MPVRTIVSIVSLVVGTVLIAVGLLIARSDPESPLQPNGIPTVSSLDTFDGWRLPTLTPTTEPAPEDTPEPTPTPVPVNMSPVARIQAPSISVDAEVITLGVTDGVMETPPDPETVAWYDFSGRPGVIGNVVMAAHVDWANYGPAVFWELRNLAVGDQVSLTLEDGTSFTYEVQSLQYFDADSAPVGEIVGSTPIETLTLITCGGTFDRSIREYDKRLVVRAVRVPDATGLQPPN